MKPSALRPPRASETGSLPPGELVVRDAPDPHLGRVIRIDGVLEAGTHLSPVLAAHASSERMQFRLCVRQRLSSWWWRPWRRWREELISAVPRVRAGQVLLYEVETERVRWSLLDPGGPVVISAEREV